MWFDAYLWDSDDDDVLYCNFIFLFMTKDYQGYVWALVFFKFQCLESVKKGP